MVNAKTEELGSRLGSFLRPGMTVALVGEGVASLAPLVAERVGPSGRLVPAEPAGLGDRLPDRVDLILLDALASKPAVLLGIRGLLEDARPALFLEFWPQKLRENATDPTTALDCYRALGLRPRGTDGELPTDPGELVLTVDAGAPPRTLLRLEPVDPPARARERVLPAGLRLGRRWERRFPPVEPRTLAYDATHRALVRSLLESEDWLARFAADKQLPHGLGAGYDERVVEFPWLLSRGLRGRVLDAGSVLNHRHVLECVLPAIDDLTIVTLAPEPVAFPELGVSYLYEDLRGLSLDDDSFDEVVSLSTLEHVGMDNSVYGAADAPAGDPRAEAAQALRELLRVVRPGGRIHLSVPFGRREEHGWLRQLDREDVDDLLASAGAGRHEEAVFLHTPRGWRRGTARHAADASYNDTPQPTADGVVAAGAVLCATIYA
jgi:SAM-dependent methyltransferase